MIEEQPFIDSEPGLSRRETFWLSVMMLVLWLISAPAWCWATLARSRLLGRTCWPARVLSAIGFCVIAVTFAAGAALGSPPGPFETPEPPEVSEAFRSVKQIMRDVDYLDLYLLNMVWEIGFTVCIATAGLALIWSLTLLGRDPVPVEERFA